MSATAAAELAAASKAETRANVETSKTVGSNAVVLAESARNGGFATRLTLLPRQSLGALTIIPAALVVSEGPYWDGEVVALAVAETASASPFSRAIAPPALASQLGQQAAQPTPAPAAAPMAAAWELMQQNRRFAREQADRRQVAAPEQATAPLRSAFKRIA